MKKIYKLFSKLIVPLAIFLLTTIVLFKGINFGVPGRDSGAFLYAGREVLLGSTPYLNFWDHKAPLVYFINAIAVAIDGHTLWGLWIVEWIFLFSTLAVLFRIIAKNFDKKTSIICIVISGITISQLLEGGNRVEEYAMFFQALAVLIYISQDNQSINKNNLLSFVLGIICAFIFLLKPNMVTILPAIGILLLNEGIIKKNILSSLKRIAFISFGFLSLIGLFLLYFSIKKAIPDAYDQIFNFNFLYSASTWNRRFSSLFFGASILLPSILISLFGIILYFLIDKTKKSKRLIQLALLWLPIEIFVSIISGREHRQYFLSWIIPLGILIPLFFYLLRNTKYRIVVFTLVFLIGFGGKTLNLFTNLYRLRPYNLHLQYRGFVFNNFDEHSETLEVIRKGSNTNDGVLIWGSEPSLLFLASRRTDSRYYYQFRLFYPGYNLDDSKTKELLDNLIAKPPKIIIDASTSTADSSISEYTTLPPLEKVGMKIWFEKTHETRQKNLIEISNFVKENYILGKKTYGGRWPVYTRNDAKHTR